MPLNNDSAYMTPKIANSAMHPLCQSMNVWWVDDSLAFFTMTAESRDSAIERSLPAETVRDKMIHSFIRETVRATIGLDEADSSLRFQ
jgi:hypothetical protein